MKQNKKLFGKAAGVLTFALLLSVTLISCGNPTGSDVDKGRLTVANFPEVTTIDTYFSVTVYDFAEEVTSMADITTVQTNLDKTLAVSQGTVASSPVSLLKFSRTGSLEAFAGTGTYLVAFARTSTMELWYADQVTFTNGCASIDFAEMGVFADLPLEDPSDKRR